jgi:hypothetical protein
MCAALLGWFLAGLVPGLCSLALIPPLVMRLNPHSITRTPEAAHFAASELAAMGSMSTGEKIVLAVFLSVCGLWITSPFHKVDIVVTALPGSCALLLSGVLSWEDVKSERALSRGYWLRRRENISRKSRMPRTVTMAAIPANAVLATAKLIIQNQYQYFMASAPSRAVTEL